MATDVLSVLTQARALISRPENWCINKFSDGKGAYCARGAVFEFMDDKNYEERYDEPYCAELAKNLPAPWCNVSKRLRPRGFSGLIADYNNTHSHDEILAVFDKTIARLKRETVIKKLASVPVMELEAA